MSLSGSTGSPSKESICTSSSMETNGNLPRDTSRFSLFSAGSTTSQEEPYKFVGHAEQSLSCMQSYLQSGKLCDVTLIAGNNGKRVQAHRLVLSAASEYFALMFTGNLREAAQTEITLGEVNGDILQSVVNYCYSGSIEIREDNVESLLSTACLMQLNEVVDACSNFLAHQLHPSNCLGIAMFAEHQSCPVLLYKARAYISEYFMQVVQNQEFLQLSLDHMLILLSSDDLNVPSEEHIFHAIINWINHEPERKTDIAQLLAFVKLPLLSPSFLADNIEPYVGDDLMCHKLIMEAYRWHLLPERRLQMVNSRTRPRKATLGKLLVVGGMDKYKGATDIESYDPRSDKWSIFGQTSGRRLQFGIALMGDKLMVVGGRDGLKTLNSMECLDLKTFTWSQMPPMNTHRHGLGVALLGGTLYAVGGHDGWSYLNTVERWDPTTRTWSFVAPMQSQRCSAGVAVLEEKLYAVGGRESSSCLKSMECYDPHTNKWTMCAPMMRRRSAVGVAVANGYLYAIGGQDPPSNNPSYARYDCVERYDPSTDSWTTVAPMTSKKDAVAACLFGNCLVAVGGYDGAQYLNTFEQYDPITNEWTLLAPLNMGRAGACVVAVPNNKETAQTNE
ncbi:kelch-like protein 5 [Coccinella septempunctata]|uniref:kelch-like protein 5 n=1 Tax=Coccinella septempunctata TaxID=41139 RepID=UPI001D074AD6|nr:kelch-like protein 5 [Coccinella septempunctata]